MRTEKSLKNISVNIAIQVIVIILGFISRKVFIDTLGSDYLGINGVLTNILSMLSLIEGGIGVSIVYQLYKPLAENNQSQVIALVQLYRKLYLYIVLCLIFLSGIIFIFLKDILNQNDTPFIGVIYFSFVLKNIISYLNAHKWSLINADQKGYVLAKYNLLFNTIITSLRIIILKITQNYILFLLIEVIIFLIQNILNGIIVNKYYPYIKTNRKYYIDLETKQKLISDVKAVFFHKIGTYVVNGTDNILISIFVNITTVGLYSNYTMIIGHLTSLLSPILGGVGASVAHLIVTEDKEKCYEIFKVMNLINFWIYSFCVIFLFNLIEPFINWWLGQGLLLDKFTFYIILVNFYIMGMRISILTFKERGGIFIKDKYIPIIESMINLIASFILAKYLGIVGIFLGTTISTLSTAFWVQSKIVFNLLFDKSVIEYFKQYFVYLCVGVLAGICITALCNLVQCENEFILLILKGAICLVGTNLVYIAIFYRSSQFQYIISVIKPRINKIKIGTMVDIA